MPDGTSEAGSRKSARPAAHVPVMLERVLALLATALSDRPATLVDATVGLGGHAEALLARHPELLLVGLDRDPDALESTTRRLARYAKRVRLVHAVYDELPEVLGDLGLPRQYGIDGILFDLGVSSLQLDDRDRGFSYARDAPLDMRMDQTTHATAADIVNGYSVPDLVRILRNYGEERYARRIALAIDRERRRAPLRSTVGLAELVRTAIPAATRRTGGHPAKRTFQALRIEVNGELDALRVAIPAALEALRIGGRIVVLSYHSLEDRIVKQSLAALAEDTTPEQLPVSLAERRPQLRPLARGTAPDASELAVNPRAASARLRAAERLRIPA